MTGASLSIRGAEVDGALVDVEVHDGVVVEIVPASVGATRSQHSVAQRVDAGGAALLPGLHDHHVHLLAMAAAVGSIRLDGADVATALQAADAQRTDGSWIRAVGYHESFAGHLDREVLDRWVPHRPVRVQHRSGALWVLNSVALQLLGDPPDGSTDGRLFRADDWLRERLAAIDARQPVPLDRVGAELAAFGITGVTDLTPCTDPAEFEVIAAAVASGALPFRVTVTGGDPLALAKPTGLGLGPVKIVVDDHRLPGLDELGGRVRRARAANRAVAMHCVTREALVLAAVVLHDLGTMAGDRIEHGAIVPPELFADLASMGVVVVTQPSFVRERGDRYLLDVDAVDQPHLWRCRSLVEHGIGVAFGSDAPFGSADPWSMMRTSVDRTTVSGAVLGAHEAIPPIEALHMLLGGPETPAVPRRLVVGMPADLCLLDRPLADALATLEASMVRATVVAGHVVFER